MARRSAAIAPSAMETNHTSSATAGGAVTRGLVGGGPTGEAVGAVTRGVAGGGPAGHADGAAPQGPVGGALAGQGNSPVELRSDLTDPPVRPDAARSLLNPSALSWEEQCTTSSSSSGAEYSQSTQGQLHS